MKLRTLELGVCLLCTAGAASAQLANPGFESPVVPVGNFTTFAVGSAGLTGWNVVGPVGTSVATVSTTYSQSGVTFQSQSGSQWMDLTGASSNSSAGVSQAVATTAGHRYELTFFVGNTTGGSVFGTTSTVNVAVNGVQSFAAVNSIANATALSWQQFTYDFVATGASTLLAFSNGDPGDDNSNGLDSIALADLGPVAAPVPEPETYALMLAGLTIVGWAARRRKT